MQRRIDRSFRETQAGGITIVVALMLLVLITIAAMGMSRNALREVSISGTSRQGAMARNVADSGIEWAVYWVDQFNAPGATGVSKQLNDLKVLLKSNPSMAGRAYNPTDSSLYLPSLLPSPTADTTLSTANGTTQGFTIALTSMGKLPITNMSQGITQGSFSPGTGAVALQAPDLWAVRADSQVTVGTGPFSTTFFHAKEAWISTPN